MIIITIEIKYLTMIVHQGKSKRARLTWTGPGLEVYVLGSLQGLAYEQAANLTVNYALGVHIAPSSIKSVKRAKSSGFEAAALISDEGRSLRRRLL